MNYYKQNSDCSTPDSRYLLASAFFRIGDTRSYTALLPKRFTDNTTGRQTGGSYASPLRNLALVLDALVDTDRDNIQIPALARQLSTALKQSQLPQHAGSRVCFSGPWQTGPANGEQHRYGHTDGRWEIAWYHDQRVTESKTGSDQCTAYPERQRLWQCLLFCPERRRSGKR